MQAVGIICEYNPLHLGHQRQFQVIRDTFGSKCGIVCLMSGNYVQRGAPAIFDVSSRAQAAVLCGADLVLELPVTSVLSSAEGFASGGVRILSSFCSHLCFGAEHPGSAAFMETAAALLSPAFSDVLKQELSTGCSFPAARQTALRRMGLTGDCLSFPNDILAVEYCKAILAQNSPLEPVPILRSGNYHASEADLINPSATAVRHLILSGSEWSALVPEKAVSCFSGAAVHSLAAGERAILAKLRTMSDSEFEELPYGSEGLWRRLMHASRSQASLEDIVTAVKTKRYTRTRIDRMILCAFLGITASDLEAPTPYTRVLAFNDRGRAILKEAKQTAVFLNAGAPSELPYWNLENRCNSLYGLFAHGQPAPPNQFSKQRIFNFTQKEA